MNRSLLLAALLIPILACTRPVQESTEDASASGAGGSGPRVVLSETVHEAGRVERGEAVLHSFRFHNAGDAFLTLEAKPTCGCTVARADSSIAPGGTGLVVAELDTAELQGTVNKIVNVLTNDPDSPLIKLRMRAEVTLPILVLPRQRVTLGGHVPSMESRALTLISLDGEPFDVLGIQSENAWLQTRLRPRPDSARRRSHGMRAEAREAVGGALIGGHAAYELELSIDQSAPPGPYTDALEVRTNHPGAESLRILVSGELDVGVIVEPRRVFFLNRGEAEQVEHVNLRQQDGRALEVLSAEADDPAFRIDVEQLTREPGAYRIAVHRDMSSHERGRVYQDELLVRTTSPGREELRIPIIAR